MNLRHKCSLIICVLAASSYIYIYLLDYSDIFLNKIISLNQSKAYSYIFESNCDCQKFEQIALIKHESHFTVVSINKNDKSTNKLYDITFDEFRELNFTCNLYDTFRRGKSQKILSYTLFGKRYFYYDKLKNISKQIKQLYLQWFMRVYHDNSINTSIICETKCTSDEKSQQLIDIVDFCNVENEVRLKPISFESLSSKTGFSGK